MTEKKSNAPDSPLRRKTLKRLAVGVGALAGSTVLPEKWMTPIIEGIALPAHAQTSAPAVTFCSDRVQLTLVDGHSGTDEMTIEASGCITQANVALDLTLLGFSAAVITSKKVGKDDSFFVAVFEALVPSAHAADMPVCTITEKVTTDANGNFKATFKLNCGTGIVQVVLNGMSGGQSFSGIGWLDIPGCNPCHDNDTATAASCADTMLIISLHSSWIFSTSSIGPFSSTLEVRVGDGLYIKTTPDVGFESASITPTLCDGKVDGVAMDNFEAGVTNLVELFPADIISKYSKLTFELASGPR